MTKPKATEQRNPRTRGIDAKSTIGILRAIHREDASVAKAVSGALPAIARAVDAIVSALQRGGRLFYVGAGTSGRLGVLDAAECPPTFGTDPLQIIGVISGGATSLVLSQEGVEDRAEEARSDLAAHALTAGDFVIGLAASRRTPYTLAGLVYAQSLGCVTAFIICNKAESLEVAPDILIELPVGPEAITGSTRMKSGTAQKMTLNIISTTAMVLLGKTFGNLMVDLQARSDKLAARSRKILMDLLDMNLEQADDLLARSAGSVKVAIVMYKHNCSAEEARQRLEHAGGFISRAI